MTSLPSALQEARVTQGITEPAVLGAKSTFSHKYDVSHMDFSLRSQCRFCTVITPITPHCSSCAAPVPGAAPGEDAAAPCPASPLDGRHGAAGWGWQIAVPVPGPSRAHPHCWPVSWASAASGTRGRPGQAARGSQ